MKSEAASITSAWNGCAKTLKSFVRSSVITSTTQAPRKIGAAARYVSRVTSLRCQFESMSSAITSWIGVKMYSVAMFEVDTPAKGTCVSSLANRTAHHVISHHRAGDCRAPWDTAAPMGTSVANIAAYRMALGLTALHPGAR